MSMPGTFPDAAEEESSPVQRAPKRRFVGRKTLEARQKQSDGDSVEETSAIVQSSESTLAHTRAPSDKVQPLDAHPEP